MTSHFGILTLFAFLVSTVFATLVGDEPRRQLRLGVRLFGGLVVGAYLAGWVMFLVFR